MDHAGFSTYDSIYRAKEIFGAKKIIIVTQKYHLYRALYIANELGIIGNYNLFFSLFIVSYKISNSEIIDELLKKADIRKEIENKLKQKSIIIKLHQFIIKISCVLKFLEANAPYFYKSKQIQSYIYTKMNFRKNFAFTKISYSFEISCKFSLKTYDMIKTFLAMKKFGKRKKQHTFFLYLFSYIH